MNNIIFQIISKVILKTNKKEINWKASLKNNCYEFSTSNMTVKIEKIFDDNPFEPESIIFLFLDNKGEIFERVNALDYFNEYQYAYAFFETIERQVNKIDEKLNTLLKEIDNI